MADLIRIQKDKLDSPSGSEDGGGIDFGDLEQELDQDEFDGAAMVNGKLFLFSLTIYFTLI